MSEDTKKPSSNGLENSLPSEEQRQKINEVRELVGTFPAKLAAFCSDESISRYLRSTNWNVKKTTKMVKDSLKWRLEYKPEEIQWDEIACEAETGKIYRSSYGDKHGRTVLVMTPRCQNSNSVESQMRYLVYCMENAIMNLPPNQQQVIWLVDFYGFSLSNISLKSTQQTSYLLQNHYPQRLGIAILYNPPKIFEPFWKLAKLFQEPETTEKVRFVYSDDPSSVKIMEELFDMDKLESAFGGKDNAAFDVSKYAERMREDDKKMASFWARGGAASEAPGEPPIQTDAYFNHTKSQSN